MTYTASKGTVFTVEGERCIITRSDQPVCEVPLSDLQEFFEDYNDADFVDDSDPLYPGDAGLGPDD